MGAIPTAGASAVGRGTSIGCVVVLLMLAVAIAPCTTAASESGVSTYHSGLADLLGGVMGPPGSLVAKSYFTYWDASARFDTPSGDSRSNVGVFADIVQIAYVTHTRILGADLGSSLLIPLVIAGASKQPYSPNVNLFADQHSTVGGLGDMIIVPGILAWHFGHFHLLAAVSAYAPSGSYDKNRFVNIGRNRWSFEPDVGLTWLDKSGREASAFIGDTVNLENMATHYTSGDEFHADFALAQHFAGGFVVGMAGYAFQQVTGDSGEGAVFGPFLNRALALGPLAGCSFRIDEKAVDLSVKYEFEFAQQNRLGGNTLWLTGSLRL